jgi:hypothetical protein
MHWEEEIRNTLRPYYPNIDEASGYELMELVKYILVDSCENERGPLRWPEL